MIGALFEILLVIAVAIVTLNLNVNTNEFIGSHRTTHLHLVILMKIAIMQISFSVMVIWQLLIITKSI